MNRVSRTHGTLPKVLKYMSESTKENQKECRVEKTFKEIKA